MIDVDAIVESITGEQRSPEETLAREIVDDLHRERNPLSGRQAPDPVERVERDQAPAQVEPSSAEEAPADRRLAALVASRHGLPEDAADLLTGDLDTMTSQAERLAVLVDRGPDEAPALPSRPQAALRPSASTSETFDPAALAREVLADTGTRRHA